MKYNLIGQRGPEGQSNAEAPEAGPYIYDTPPGIGDNKGLKEDGNPVAKAQHNRKVEKYEESVRFTGTSVIDKPVEEADVEATQRPVKVFDSGISKWWQFLGYDSLDEANKSIAMGELSMAAVNRAKEEVKPEPADPIPPEEKEIPEYPKTLFNDKGQVSTVNNETEEYFAKRMGYISEPKNLSLSAGINFLRDYEEKKDFTVTDKEKIEIETNQTKANLDNLLNTGEISQGEFNAFSKALNNLNNNAGTELKTGSGIENENKNVIQKKGKEEEKKNPGEDKTIVPPTVEETNVVGSVGSNQATEFNNIPRGARVFDVEGDYYLGYLVPGGDGTLYTGSIYLMYSVPGNDFVKAGLLTDASAFKGANSFLTKEELNQAGALVVGDTDELEGIEGNPFKGFVERVSNNLSIAPWLGTVDGLALAAETRLEGRDPDPGEYAELPWYNNTTEEQRAWYELSFGRGFDDLPLDAQQAYQDTRRVIKNELIGLGISGGFDPSTGELRDLPQGLVDYIAKKRVTGQWSSSKTTEQLLLFADPFAAGERDEEFFSVIETGGYQIDRQTQYEDTVRQEALKWLGPVAGNFNAGWVANWASKIRSGEADAYEQLQTLLKQQRVALFDAYTNPELTYNDISQPWRNIVENAWGEVPDESETYFQDIVKNNNVTYANEVLTKVGLERGNDNVVNDALGGLEQAIGQGSVRRSLGANT